MKIANSQPTWLPPDFSKPTGKGVVHQNSVPPPAILFGKVSPYKTAPQTQIDTEFKRLQKTEPFFRWQSLMVGAVLPTFSLLLPTPYTASILNTLLLPFIPIIQIKRAKEINLQRAKFNVTGNRNNLNPFLPYRRLLTQKASKDKQSEIELKKYDQLVDEVLQKAEFYDVTSGLNLENLITKAIDPEKSTESEKQDNLFKTLRGLYNFDERKTIFSKEHKKNVEKLEKINDVALSEAIRKHAKFIHPLKMHNSDDPSTRVRVAAEMVELYHKNPELLKQLLNDPKGHPLRVMLKQHQAVMTGGWYKPGLNLIALNKGAFWASAGLSTIAQHESIHAASDIRYKVKSVLPTMSAEQKKVFKTARATLINQYKQKDETLLGKFRYWLTAKTSTGIRNYAFWNNYEFLTVTLDAFKANPKQLIKTQAGQDIYTIYKDIFKIDPVNDFPPSKSGYKALFKKIFGKEPYLNLSASE